MTLPLDDFHRKSLLEVFRMPLAQSMLGRKSSITNAFVNAIIPIVNPSAEEIHEALTILEMTPETTRCAYCGDKQTEWDHLRPLVDKMRPTGFISEIANLVPSCSKCNQSKGNKYWKTWMCGSSKLSPRTRAIADVDSRIARLEAYERWRAPTKVDFQSLLGDEAWQHYWKMWENLNGALAEAQAVANEMRDAIRDRVKSSKNER
ncbi:HNH endonuclease [Anatilimnocola floriformis]|uniref:HNH endonuclease n=1 Tax=Anatilimnocola floriformis TaxID=2948575 RepID=UPI0020C2146E|nr:HNH endonuclease signature motif containing protein [Anatilimnocola floriformis]